MKQTINWERNFIYLVGRNGSGKTTLVNNLLKNQFLKEFNVAYLDQYALKNIDRILISVNELIDSVNFLQNDLNFKQKKENILKYFNLHHLLNNKTSELSGGEKQILLVCMQLLKNVDLYIFDEPFNNLDSKVIKLLSDYLVKLALNHKVLVISHHLDYINPLSTVYEINNHKILNIFKGENY